MSKQFSKNKLKSLNVGFNKTFVFKEVNRKWMEPTFIHLRNDNMESNLSSNGNNFKMNKTHILTWIVSNCQTQSRRERFVQKLQLFLPVKILGACGEKKIEKPPGIPITKVYELNHLNIFKT